MAEISSDGIRGYHDTMILYILKRGPSYGYEISKEITRITEGKYRIKETTLYSAFSRLKKNGLVHSYTDVGEDSGKRRTYYALTDNGEAYYRSACDEWTLVSDVVSRFIM